VPLKQKVAKCLPFLQGAGLVTTPPPCETGPYLSAILEAAGDRVKMAGDVLDYTEFYVADDALPYDMTAVEKRITKPENAKPLLTAYAGELASVEPFEPADIETHLKEFVERQGVKIGDLVHAVRVAVSGKAVGFGLFETLAILGRERCVRRIERALML
jgi:glutamyl-tRNA synthetase